MKHALVLMGCIGLLLQSAMGVVAISSTEEISIYGHASTSLEHDFVDATEYGPNLASFSKFLADSAVTSGAVVTLGAAQTLWLNTSGDTIHGHVDASVSVWGARLPTGGGFAGTAKSEMILIFQVTEPQAFYHIEGLIIRSNEYDYPSTVNVHIAGYDNGRIGDIFATGGYGGPFNVSGWLPQGTYMLKALAWSSTGIVNQPGSLGMAFTISPTPEPGTLALLAIAGLGALRRRMR